eukprot:TRINITY_DN821_c0_g4_i4.p1 TRINITY_DN821_c0_g4~~TRINITY_DN821_c0_g4_i4.p1  ORF type:complete len:367 (-),score=111.31 TRINITY_DN821_c0_g4_i4:61-1161(-)
MALEQGSHCWLTLRGSGHPTDVGGKETYLSPGGIFEAEVTELTTMTVDGDEVPAVRVRILDVLNSELAPREFEGKDREGYAITIKSHDFRQLAGRELGPIPMGSKFDKGVEAELFHEAGGSGFAAVSEMDDEFPGEEKWSTYKPPVGSPDLVEMATERWEGGFEDMVQMRCLSDAELARNLRFFFKRDRCYCMCGPTLVAINTFKDTGVFNLEEVQNYSASPPLDRPHCFKMAQEALNAVRKENQSRAIVITGESGAGKSFTTNRILDYLTAVETGRDAVPPFFQIQEYEKEIGSYKLQLSALTTAQAGLAAEFQHKINELQAEVMRLELSLIHISEPTRLLSISYAVFCLKKKKKKKNKNIETLS